MVAKRLTGLFTAIVLAVGLMPAAAFAAPLEAAGVPGKTVQTVDAPYLTAASKAKTYWYSLGFGKVKVKTGKASFKVTGKISRATSLNGLFNSKKYKALPKKTRTFKVAKKVTFYGSDWQPSNKKTKTRAEALKTIKTSSSHRYVGMAFKCKNGMLVEMRLGA